MFDLKKFVMDTLRGMKDTEPEYRVRQYALGWFQKDVLTVDDLAEVESWYAEEETPAAEDERNESQ